MDEHRWRFFDEEAAPRHAIHRVFDPDTGTMFDATPCYGMHAPWWVPRNGYTREESEPIAALGTYWREMPEPPGARRRTPTA